MLRITQSEEDTVGGLLEKRFGVPAANRVTCVHASSPSSWISA